MLSAPLLLHREPSEHGSIRLGINGVSQNMGYFLGGPCNKDCSILGSTLGSCYFGKLPMLLLLACAPEGTFGLERVTEDGPILLYQSLYRGHCLAVLPTSTQ